MSSASEHEFSVQVVTTGTTGVLQWSGRVDQATLDKAVSLATDDSLLGRGLDRIEVSIPTTDMTAIRALHKAGFRREGRRRRAFSDDHGASLDVYVYARLASDQVYGEGGFSAVMDTVLPTHRVLGQVLFTDPAHRLLLVKPLHKGEWELPGGVIEPGESPRVGAEREILEELGIAISLGDPVLVDWMPPYQGWSDALGFIFRGGELAANTELTLPAQELAESRWVGLDELDSLMRPPAAQRLRTALAGKLWYTENGAATS